MVDPIVGHVLEVQQIYHYNHLISDCVQNMLFFAQTAMYG